MALTATWRAASPQLGAAIETRTGGPALRLVFEAAVVQPVVLPGATPIADLVARRARQPGGAAALARARQRMADELASSPLARLRLQQGLSQTALAERAQTTQAVVARIEQGRQDPGTDLLRRLAMAMGRPAAEVFDAVLQTRAGVPA